MMKNVTAMENAASNLLNLKFNEFDLKLKSYASSNSVPIIVDEGLAFLEMLIRIHKPKRILEIGTAIGFSAIRMHRVCNSDVVTIERNPKMYEVASTNVKEASLEDHITIIFKDALEAYDLVKNQKFDLIFIDAAKAQYTKFFDLYTPLLNNFGLVICDNMLFHGLVEDKSSYQSQTRSVRGLIRKLTNFQNYLLNNEEYDTTIIEIGDGMAVSVKKS